MHRVHSFLYCITFHDLTDAAFGSIIQIRKLRYTNMGKVLRSQSQEPPHVAINLLQSEFMFQIQIFVFQLIEVSISNCNLMIFSRNGFQIQQSSLSHEYCFYLEEVVTMM